MTDKLLCSVITGSPLSTALATLVDQREAVCEAIVGLFKTFLELFSSTRCAGVSTYSKIQYLPPGLMVGTFAYRAHVKHEVSTGKNTVLMWAVRTVVCTSKKLISTAANIAYLNVKRQMILSSLISLECEKRKVAEMKRILIDANMIYRSKGALLRYSNELQPLALAMKPEPDLHEITQPDVFHKALIAAVDRGKWEGSRNMHTNLFDIATEHGNDMSKLRQAFEDESKFLQAIVTEAESDLDKKIAASKIEEEAFEKQLKQ